MTSSRSLLITGLAAALLASACSSAAPSAGGSASAPTSSQPASSDPAKPKAPAVEEVEVGEHKLPGVITRPDGERKPIAVVLVWGSGPHDKDGTIGKAKNTPFVDLAEGLAAHGITSIRFDKRTKAHPEAFKGDFTLAEEYYEDVAAAITMLHELDDPAAPQVFVVGHSQGGMVLPELLDQNDTAGGISLAGTPRSLWEVLCDQQDNLLEGLDLSDEQRAARKRLNAKNRDAALAIDSADDQVPLSLAGSMPASYIADLNSLDAAATAKSLDVPMLFLQGEADKQVFMEGDFDAWQQALEGKDDVEFRSYPGLSHFFWKTDGANPIEDMDTPGKFDQQVIDDMAAWLVEQAG